MQEDLTEAQDKLLDLDRRHKALLRDTTVQGRSLRVMTKNYDQLNSTYELLLEKNKELLSGSQKETEGLFGDLQKSQSELQKQSDALERSEERRVGKECRSRWTLYH